MSIDLSIAPVVANLESREWIQGEMRDGDAVCAHGAVQTCKELKPGDVDIIRAVMRRYGLTEGWNDADGRTKDEVLDKLRSIEITDAALEFAFGPQWEAIVALVRRAAVLTLDEACEFHATRGAAWDGARNAARGVERLYEWDAAWLAAWHAARVASGDAARPAAQDAAAALAVRDLISADGFTQEHYDILTRPWATVIGKVHPDDVERKE